MNWALSKAWVTWITSLLYGISFILQKARNHGWTWAWICGGKHCGVHTCDHQYRSNPVSAAVRAFSDPERVSMPDIDVDFCFERRQEVIDYVVRKYGKDRVVQIVTFGTLQARGVLRDVGRVMDLPYAFVDSIAKMIPKELNITLINP